MRKENDKRLYMKHLSGYDIKSKEKEVKIECKITYFTLKERERERENYHMLLALSIIAHIKNKSTGIMKEN